MMTKKTYEAVAAAFRDTYVDPDTDPNVALSDVAEKLADLFADDNPRFSRDQFLTACGVKA